MRTMVIVGLVVGPVLVLGVPLALASGVTPPPWGTSSGAFALAAVAALGGVVLLVLSRGRRATLPASAPTMLPAPVEPPAAERPAVVVPTVVTRPAGPRYVATEATASPVGARSRYVTLRTHRTTVAMRERTGVRAG